jgi:hypothetical protein
MKKLDLLIAAIFALALLLLSIGHARAQQSPPCLPVKQFHEALTKAHQTMVGVGHVGEGYVILFYAAPDGNFFTILSVDLKGRACVLAAGADWDQGRIPSSTARDA